MHSIAETLRQFAQNTDVSFCCCHCVNDSLQSVWTTVIKTTTTMSHKRLSDEYNDHVTTKTTSHFSVSMWEYIYKFFQFFDFWDKILFLIGSCRWLIASVVVFSLHLFTFVTFVKILIFWRTNELISWMFIIRSSLLVETER